MFRKICLIIVTLALVCFVAQAAVNTTEINFDTVTSGTFDQSLRGWIDTLNTDITNAGGLFNVGTGVVFYVDSGAGNASTVDGRTIGRAFPTLDDAFDSGNATASRGDIIYVAQGHNEALTAADGVDVDVAGVTIVGLGNGALRATLDYDAAAGEFVIGAANVKVIGLRFRTSFNAVTKAIDVEDAGDNASIIGCEFGYAETLTDEFASAIWVSSGVVDSRIANCWFDAGGQAAVTGVSMCTVTGLRIEDNTFFGDYSTACIAGTGSASGNGHLPKEVFILRNILFNGTMGGDGEINDVRSLAMADSSSGYVAHNDIINAEVNGSGNQTGLTMRVGDDMVFINNMMTATDGDEFSGGIESGTASITLSEASD